MSEQMTTVECLNENCEKEFETTSLKCADEVVTCPHCNSDHLLDEDYGENDNIFWYLKSIKPT